MGLKFLAHFAWSIHFRILGKDSGLGLGLGLGLGFRVRIRIMILAYDSGLGFRTGINGLDSWLGLRIRIKSQD